LSSLLNISSAFPHNYSNLLEMPRQSRGGAGPARSAPSRPTVAPSRPNVAPPQQRNLNTAAHPTATTATPQRSQQANSGSGLFGQMASTAAGVAVGSSIGHAIGGFFGGGSTQATENQDSALASQAQEQQYGTDGLNRTCEADARSFTRCLDENKGSDHQMSICGWYLDQLKACQSAANRY